MTKEERDSIIEAFEQLDIAISKATPHPVSDGTSAYAVTMPRKYALVLRSLKSPPTVG